MKVVESNESVFALDKKVTVANTEEIILQAIEKLIERDNPSLETIKMQVLMTNLSNEQSSRVTDVDTLFVNTISVRSTTTPHS